MQDLLNNVHTPMADYAASLNRSIPAGHKILAIDMNAKGYPMPFISSLLAVSTRQISIWLNPLRTYTPEFKASVVRERRTGLTYEQIRLKHRLGASTVAKWTREGWDNV